jgi:cobalt-zinc-cadmium efflux system outer membrane protein
MLMMHRNQNNKTLVRARSLVLFGALVLTITTAPTFAQSCMPLPDTVAAQLPIGLVEARLPACNREVIAARRAAEAAGADRQIAGQRPNPTLTLGVNNINPKTGVGSGPLRDKAVDSSVRIDQLVERGDKGGLREQQADANILAAEADYFDALRVQRAQVRALFLELGYQQSRSKVMREFAQLANDSLKAAEKRHALGDIAEIDLSRFRLDAARAENDARAAELDLAKARADFARSIGADSQAAVIVVDTALPAAAFNVSAADVSAKSVAERRADVMSANYRVSAAEAASALARAISTRDISFGAQFDRWPTTENNTQGTGNSFGFTVSIPLFVRHANEGEARRASVELQSARDVALRAVAVAESEVNVSSTAWISAADRARRVERDLLPLAKRVAAAAEFAYLKGATSVLELLDARRNLKQAELDAALARADTGKSWAAFVAATEPFPKSPSGVSQ